MLLTCYPKMYFPPHHKKHSGLLVFYTNLHHCQNKLNHGALFLSAFISPHWYDDVCDHVYLNMYSATISVCTVCMCVNLPKSPSSLLPSHQYFMILNQSNLSFISLFQFTSSDLVIFILLRVSQ